jgi:hypothetical protein
VASGGQLNERAVRLRITDPDLQRSRLTTAFRLLLVIPHLIWLAGWFSLATLVAIANWIATVISGRPSPMLHRFLSAYVRYAAHVVAYLSFTANRFPGFTGRPGSYAIEVDIDPPERQNRWTAGFRLVLALPAIALADAMLGFGSTSSGGTVTFSGGILATVAFLGWFVCLARGRMARGLRDLAAYAIGYSAQATGYVFLLTGRYPNSDPGVYEWANVYRTDPIRLSSEDDLRRSRLTVFFRILLAVPHFVWLVLWGIAVLFAALANWFATLVRGRPADSLHRFLSAYLRYQIHVFAFVQLVANPFPGFVGRAGSYPVDLEIDGPDRQNRWITGFRLLLAIPALFISGALSSAAYLAAFLSWFYALATGRVPRGLRNLGAFELRYTAQAYGYVYLLTDNYPYSGPSAGWQLSLAPAEQS